MHNLRTVKPKSKVAIMEMIRNTDLMPPTRSTIHDPETLPCDRLSLGDVKDDIVTLGWQECPIGSLATVSVLSAAGSAGSAASSAAMKKKKKINGKRRSISMSLMLAIPAAEQTDDAIAAAAAIGNVAGKKKKKLKRLLLCD